MSRSKATKRRKVWANWYPATGVETAHWGTRLGTKADACMAAQPCAEQVCLVERLPGDVVLSREQADLICRRLNDLYDVTVQDKHEIRALLRGRR